MSRSITILMSVIILLDFYTGAIAGESSDLASLSLTGSIVELRTGGGTMMRITFIDQDMVRIQATQGEEFTGENSGIAPIVLEAEPVEVSLQHTDLGSHHVFATSSMELVVHCMPLRLELHRVSDGAVLWRELKPLMISGEGTTQTLTSTPAERFYGGGQQNGTFQFKGRLMEISYSGWEEGDRPNPAPFYMSDGGYAVLRNSWTDGSYDFRSDNYLTATHAENRFDAYYLVGDSIHELLDSYTELTGRARLLPRWAFGYGDADCYNDGDNVEKPGTVPEGWSDGDTGTTPDVVTSVAEKYREHDMPGSWILPNDGYGCGYTDLPLVVNRLSELGFRTGLWTENGVEQIAWEVGTAGTRVQKLDVAWTGKGYQWALDANHAAARGFLDYSQSRPFIWTVMGWAGIQRYAVTWTGDQSGSWDFIRWHIPTLIGSGLSGMNYSTGDVDGIYGGSPETFTRDLQWKSFTTVFMGMSGWSRSERKHPWWFEEPYRSINRRYLKLRQRLMPYIYTLARETELTGAPMVRGTMWDHPEDPHADDYPNQFFLGRELLIAPVYSSQSASGGWREDVYLPEGRWIDYWNGNVVDAGAGGKLLNIPVDLATTPVFVRAGAIIPMYPESLYDGQLPPDPLTLDLYPRGNSSFVIYEDDGNSRAYRAGAFSTQSVTMSEMADADRIELTIAAATGEFPGRLDNRDFVIQLHSRVAPATVTVDGAALEHNQQLEGAGKRSWHYNPDDRSGVIQIHTGRLNTRTAHTVVVELDPQAIPVPAGSYPLKPAGNGTIPSDRLMVVSRTTEEPGYPLENAFDGDPDSWFRTLRDQSVAYGPHEFTLALGGRPLLYGFRISPRNDQYWQYGQVHHYEFYLADVNGRWGEPVARGALEQSETEQEVHFPPAAGRLLRFRVLSTHDAEVDPSLNFDTGLPESVYDPQAPVQVGPLTISEFSILEQPPPTGRADTTFLAETMGRQLPLQLNGLEFQNGISTTGSSRCEFELEGGWHTLRTEVGIDDSSPVIGNLHFQVWGDGRLLWDSGIVSGNMILKPRIDIRGVGSLSLRTHASEQRLTAAWVETMIIGYEGDLVNY